MKENLENQNIEINNNVLSEVEKKVTKKNNLMDNLLSESDMETLLEDLMAHGAHFGHPQVDSKCKKLLFTICKLNGSNIINLDKTINNLMSALKLLFYVISKGEKVLFATTNQMYKNLFKEFSIKSGASYIIERYQPGTFTNSNHFFDKKRKLEENKNTEDDSLTKKERKVLKNKRQRTENYFSGLKELNEIPKLIITIGGDKENLIKEAKKMNIGVICFSDINITPITGHNYITIPFNTKSIEGVEYIFDKHIRKVMLNAYEQYLNNNKKILKEKDTKELKNKPQKTTIEEVEQKMKDSILNKAETIKS